MIDVDPPEESTKSYDASVWAANHSFDDIRNQRHQKEKGKIRIIIPYEKTGKIQNDTPIPSHREKKRTKKHKRKDIPIPEPSQTKDMTKYDNYTTRHDKTRQEETRQDKTRKPQDNHKITTRQPQDNHKTRLQKTRQDNHKTRQDKTNQDETATRQDNHKTR